MYDYGWLCAALIYLWAAMTVYQAARVEGGRHLAFWCGTLWPVVLFFLPGFAKAWKAPLPDPFTMLATENQKRSSTPGCKMGADDCSSMTCSCDAYTPCNDYILLRAKRLRAGKKPNMFSPTDRNLP